MMDHHEEPHTALITALHKGLYLAIIMDRYEGHHITLTIVFVKRPLISYYNERS
jgi:hypothetical protein